MRKSQLDVARALAPASLTAELTTSFAVCR